MDRSSVIFGNKMSARDIAKAEANKKRFIDKYGDDSDKTYHLSAADTPAIGDILGVKQLVISEESGAEFNDKSLVVGNIRMGFGHYRISMAIASAAKALGYEPYWFDLCSFGDTTCGKVIAGQNELYSLGSRMSQSVPLFNKLVWEPLNSEGFRQLSYNCSDQKAAELMTPVYADLPKDIPFVATHVWPSQAAVHAGLTHVVNAIPDNWAMALHLSEGALHTVQTPSAYLAYRALRGMDKDRQLSPMPEDSIEYTGHYVDHELVSNIEADCEARCKRAEKGGTRRWLMSVGGAGAQKEIFVSVIKKLLPYIAKKQAALFVNVGDHMDVWEAILKEIPKLGRYTMEHFNDFEETKSFVETAHRANIYGIHVFCHSDIFAAVYSTNLLMRCSDVLITKPSELSFYPVPKLMIKRVGGHEAWGAIRSAEVGDGTYECSTPAETCAMIDLMQNSGDIVKRMCGNILAAKAAGIYDGAYKVVKLAAEGRTLAK